MTKETLRTELVSGKTMDELFHYTDGQLCTIYKADEFAAGREIIYIPDISFNHIPADRSPESNEELEAVIAECFTGDDFVDECSGDGQVVQHIFLISLGSQSL